MEKAGRGHHAKVFLHRMAHEKPGSIPKSNKHSILDHSKNNSCKSLTNSPQAYSILARNNLANPFWVHAK